MTLIALIGILPAIIFPGGTFIQLLRIYQSKNVEGVSVVAWCSFAVGNLSLYIYTGKYTEIQSIIALLGTLVLQLMIVALIFRYRKKTVHE